jgi:hypothetical protein
MRKMVKKKKIHLIDILFFLGLQLWVSFFLTSVHSQKNPATMTDIKEQRTTDQEDPLIPPEVRGDLGYVIRGKVPKRESRLPKEIVFRGELFIGETTSRYLQERGIRIVETSSYNYDGTKKRQPCTFPNNCARQERYARWHAKHRFDKCVSKKKPKSQRPEDELPPEQSVSQ